MAAVSSSLGAKVMEEQLTLSSQFHVPSMLRYRPSLFMQRSPDREVVEEETEQKRPALVDGNKWVVICCTGSHCARILCGSEMLWYFQALLVPEPTVTVLLQDNWPTLTPDTV